MQTTVQFLIILQSINVTILTLAVPLRLYVSFQYARAHSLYRHIGDSLCVFSLFLVWVCGACSWWRGTSTLHNPSGLDTDIHAKLVVVEVFGYTTVLWGVKGVFLCMYLGMTERLELKRKGWLWAGCIGVAGSYLVVIAMHVGYCWPFHRNWMYGAGACRLTELAPVVVAAVLNVATDVIIMSLPLILFRKLVLRNLWPVLFLVSLGLFTTIATLVRVNLGYGNKLSNSGVREAPVLDFTRRAEMWVSVELFVAMLAACMPALRTAWVIRREGKKTRRMVTTEMGWSPKEAGKEAEMELMNSGSDIGARRNIVVRRSLTSLEGMIGVLPSLRSDEFRQEEDARGRDGGER